MKKKSKGVFTDFEKGKIVAYRDCGLTFREIAVKLGRDYSGVAKFFKKYSNSGVVERKQGSGRKKKATTSKDSSIVKLAKSNRNISTSMIKKKLNLDISVSTIKRRLHNEGLYSHFKIKKPWISPKNVKKTP